MDIFIYFSERLGSGLDEIEDALDDALGDLGNVVGVGTGVSGSNIDIEVKSECESEDVVQIIRSVLVKFMVPKSSVMDVNGVEYKVFDSL